MSRQEKKKSFSLSPLILGAEIFKIFIVGGKIKNIFKK